MTRRITVMILLTVWVMLIAGGLTAYLTTRAVLLADMDSSLVKEMLSLSEVNDDHSRKFKPLPPVEPGARYLVRSLTGQRMDDPTTHPVNSSETPQIVSAAFGYNADQGRTRSVTVRATAVPVDGTEPMIVTIVHSDSTQHLDAMLNALGASLIVATCVGGIIAAILARAVARGALLPLRSTADLVGAIDERTLHHRIEVKGLPVELVPMATRLNEMLTRLEDACHRRQQFLADASHELRTPVAALLTSLEVALRRDRDAGAYRTALQESLTDARMMSRLVEGLLETVHAGGLPERAGTTVGRLEDIIRECTGAVRSLARAKSIDLQVESDGSNPMLPHTERIRSILMNLLGNAIEYNMDNGKVWLRCATDVKGVRLEVANTGPSIPTDQVSRLFEPFYRLDAAHTTRHLGLGLSLVREHAAAMGGTCEAISHAGINHFNVQFPHAGMSNSSSKVDESPSLKEQKNRQELGAFQEKAV
jgi:signal transduction histidine kinase